jgi:undecaprenyl-diphosphatase
MNPHPPPWHPLDLKLFHALGAGEDACPNRLVWAMAWAQRGPWVLLVLAAAAVVPTAAPVGTLALALLQAGALQWLGKRLARRWPTPRPFGTGHSPNHLAHGGRAGFPSSHALAMGAVVAFLAVCPGTLGLAWGLAGAATLLTAWGRVYSGAHFPLDVAVGLLLGGAWGAAAAGLLA